MDGVYKLDNDLGNQLNEMDDMLMEGYKLDNGFIIVSIRKEKGFPSWEKEYVVTIKKRHFETEVTIPINGAYYPQKVARNTIEVILNEIDMDEVKEKYKEYLENNE